MFVEVAVFGRRSRLPKVVNIAFFGKFQVRRGRVFVFTDIMVANVGDELSGGPVPVSVGPATLTTTVPVGPGGGGSATGTVTIPRISTAVGPIDADVQTQLLSVDLAVLAATLPFDVLHRHAGP